MVRPGESRVIILSVGKRGSVSCNKVVIIHKVKETSCVVNMVREINVEATRD